jgi:glycosyltransferase involved in cell wall biosynthesis
MKILWILPYAPTAIRTRPHYLLRALLRRGHELTLATVCETGAESTALEQLEALGVRVVSERLSKPRAMANMAASSLKGKPMQSGYSWCAGLARRVEALLREEEFQAVHVEHLRGAKYGQLARRVLAEQGREERVVWDSVDCISMLFEQAARSSRSLFGRWVTRLELPRTRAYEGELVRTFRTTLVTSANDKNGMERLAGASLPQVTVLPNGVDSTYFCPTDVSKATAEVVFSGKLSYHANVTAALHLVQEVMPYVWAVRPEATVVLAGKDPAKELVRLGQADRRVIITGTVDDLRPFLRRATVAAALVPYGAGVQNKVLEAMACGTAVVGSPQAAAALHVDAGKEMLVVEGAQAQARALLQVMEDDILQAKLSMAGRAYIKEQHDWARIAGQLEGIYQVGYEGH